MDRTIDIKDTIIWGDVYAGLSCLPDASIRVSITSPPYWKQRDYGFSEQIGQEKTPEEYIGRLVAIFRLLREKLTNDGIFFLNVGDKYMHRYGKSHLLQIPYRLAFHMIQDGWILQDILIWYKPNHMPSSVKDRFTNTYEPILVFAKSKDNIYRQPEIYRVLEIPLQQTRWKHTAVYPERLVYSLLQMVELKDYDVILDPFAGTGTTGAVIKQIRQNIYGKRLYFTLIEKGKEFIEIIKKRVGVNNLIQVHDLSYKWSPVREQPIELDGEKRVANTNKFGEVIITSQLQEFEDVLRGMASKEFKLFHREDALFFVGIIKPHIKALYYAYFMLTHGYVLRNTLVIRKMNSLKWFPIFMFSRDSTKVAYRFDIDRLREQPKVTDTFDWTRETFAGMHVRDVISKETRNGYVVKVIEKYNDGFPKIVACKFHDNGIKIFPVLHITNDDVMREGLRFLCPNCNSQLVEPYDPIGENKCPVCQSSLWTSLDDIPIIVEPEEVEELGREIERLTAQQQVVIDNLTENNESVLQNNRSKVINSKFAHMARINWGASPGARKQMLGTYFTRLRLYKVEQPAVAQYLTLLRLNKNLSIKQITDLFPASYKHTVGHWFRKDFGGSIPLPEDIAVLKQVLGDPRKLLSLLEKTALKYQTVKTSVKGKNPGDYMQVTDVNELKDKLQRIFMPSYYCQSVK